MISFILLFGNSFTTPSYCLKTIRKDLRKECTDISSSVLIHTLVLFLSLLMSMIEVSKGHCKIDGDAINDKQRHMNS